MRTGLISKQAVLAAFDDVCDCHKVIEAIKALPPVIPNGWIPCNEKMPENEATVLVTVAFPSGIMPKVLEMSYSDGRWYRNDMLVSPWWVVVAWRPMPKPYFEGVLCGWAFEEEWEKQNESRIQ